MRLSLAIQHHPRRAELLPRLLAALAPLEAEVVADPDPDARPSPWRTYRLALERTPAWATHRVIVQDDAVPCHSFAATLERAVTARPDRLLALCVCGNARSSLQRIRRAAWNREAWVVLDPSRFVPVVAVVWPAALVAPALAYVDEQAWPQRWLADDEIVGRIARGLRQPVLATVPSLVHHGDDTESLIGRRARFGRDPARVTVCFVEENCDPLEIVWEAGPR